MMTDRQREVETDYIKATDTRSLKQRLKWAKHDVERATSEQLAYCEEIVKIIETELATR